MANTGGLITLEVKVLHRDGFRITLEPGAEVIDLRRQVAERLGVASDALDTVRMIYMGRVLKDTEPLSVYNLSSEHPLHVVLPRRNDAPAPQADVQSSQQQQHQQQHQQQQQQHQQQQQQQQQEQQQQQPPGGMGGLGGAIPDITQALLGALQGLGGNGRVAVRFATADGNGQQQQQQQQQQPAAPPPPPQQQQQQQQPHLHHHHHHQHHPQTLRGFVPAAPAASAARPFVQGVQVVVHATPADLDGLPQRLAQFQREVAGLQGGAAPPVSLASPGQQQQQQQPHHHHHPPAPPQAAEGAAAASPSSRLMDRMVAALLEVVQMPDLVTMTTQGDTRCLNRAEADVVRLLREELGEDTPAARQRLADDGARGLLDDFVANAEAMAVLRRDGVAADAAEAVPAELLGNLQRGLRELIDVTLDADRRGGRAFNEALADAASRLSHRCTAVFAGALRGGRASADELTAAVLRREVERSMPMMPAEMQPMAATLIPTTVAMILRWVRAAYDRHSAEDAQPAAASPSSSPPAAAAPQ